MTADDIYTLAGSSSGTAGHSGNGGYSSYALLDQPRNVALDAAGNLYIDDTSNNRVQFVAKTSCPSSCPFGLSTTTANYVYTIAGSATGTSGSSGDGGVATSALLNMPKGLTLDSAGNLYIVDANNNRVQEVAASTSTQWGISMNVDNIYTVAGSSSGTAGSTGDTGVATSALLSAPRDVVVDAGGDVYIADGGNNRIQEISASNSTQWGTAMTENDIYTIAGSSTGSSGSSGDGGAANSAYFDIPGGIAIDNAGDLFVTDESNNEVREVTHDVVAQYGYATVNTVPYQVNSVEDSLNETTTFAYASSGCPASALDCISSTTDPSGLDTTTWSYSLNGSGTGTVLVTVPITSTPTAESSETLYGVNQYDLAAETDGYASLVPATKETTLNPATGTPYVVRQPAGGFALSRYDVFGNTTAAIDARGDATTTQYNTLDEPLVTTSPLGEVTTNTYNSAGDLTNSSQPIPSGGTATTTYAYSDTAHPDKTTAKTDPNTHVWSYTYTADGLEASETDPVGNETTYTYNSLNEKATMVSPRGNVMGGSPASFTTTYLYDPLGNLAQTIDPLGDVTFTAYNAVGNEASSSNGDGDTTTAAYDRDGQVATATQTGGATATYQYNMNESQASSTNADGKTTTYAYDNRGELNQQTAPLSETTDYSYDGNGNKVQTTDPDGNITKYAYNAANQLIAQTNGYGTAAAVTLTYTYDADGNKTSYSDGSGNTTTYGYNALDQLVSSTDPLGKTADYTYDAAGNKVAEINPDGQTTTWSYYTNNKLHSISYSDGVTHSVTYTYDPDSNVATMIDASGTSTYGYDDADRLTSYQNGAGATVSYGYDAAGNNTSITYATGKTVTQTFDTMNRLASVTDWNSHTTQFGYDANGNLTSINYPSSSGLVDARTYWDDGQVKLISDSKGGTGFASFYYSVRDYDGSITSETDTGTPGAGTNTNTYNALQEVTMAGSESYSYDSSMDLTTAPSGNTQGFNADSEVCWSGSGSGTCATPPAGATTHSYSNEGNRTTNVPSSGTSDTYGWTQSNELKSVTPSSGNATSYVYDGNNLLQSETTASATTEFTWNVQASIPLMLSDGTNYYIYGPGNEPVEQIVVSGGSTSYLLSDQLGSTRAITNSSGTVTGTVTFDAWGNETGTWGSITTPFLFAGQYLDAPSGFYYLRARWYDPGTGQFASVDPSLPTTGQAFEYADNDPINTTDVSGQNWYLPPIPWEAAAVLGAEIRTGSVGLDLIPYVGEIAAIGAVFVGDSYLLCGELGQATQGLPRQLRVYFCQAVVYTVTILWWTIPYWFGVRPLKYNLQPFA